MTNPFIAERQERQAARPPGEYLNAREHHARTTGRDSRVRSTEPVFGEVGQLLKVA